MALLVGISWSSDAQKYSLRTNLIEWGNLGTVNLDAGMSVSRHFTISAGCKYNPWKFHTKSGMPVFNNQVTAYAGARYWPFYTYTGWWFGANIRYSDFAQTGVIRPKYFTGQSVGASISAGYAWMITEHLRIELGAGLWGGRHLKYEAYRTYDSMDLVDKGPRNFIFLDDVSLALVYVF